MHWIAWLGLGVVLGAQPPWQVAPGAIDLREGLLLRNRSGHFTRVFRSPGADAFLLLEGRSGLDNESEQDNTLSLYEPSGRRRWRLHLPGLAIDECRLAEGARFVHLGARGADAQGRLMACILTLDAQGKEISRVANVHAPGPLLFHVNRQGSAFYTGTFEDQPGDTNRWSVHHADFGSGRCWTHVYDGGRGPKCPGSLLAVSASGSHVIFGWQGTVFSWSAEDKELWHRESGAGFTGWFTLSDDGRRLLRGSGTLACDDNTTGLPLWQVPAPDAWAHGFIDGTHLAYWYAWEPSRLPPMQARAMRLVILDEKGQERDRFRCPVPREAVRHAVQLTLKAGRIAVRLQGKRLMGRKAAWLGPRG